MGDGQGRGALLGVPQRRNHLLRADQRLAARDYRLQGHVAQGVAVGRRQVGAGAGGTHGPRHLHRRQQRLSRVRLQGRQPHRVGHQDWLRPAHAHRTPQLRHQRPDLGRRDARNVRSVTHFDTTRFKLKL